MKRSKWREIIAIFLILIFSLNMPGMQGSIVCAEEYGNTQTPRRVAITRPGIIADRDFGVLHISNISLIIGEDAGGALQSSFCCDVTNTGSRIFKGALRLCFYDSTGSLMIVLLGYFGDKLLPGGRQTITSSTNLDMTDAFTFSIQKHSWENKDINASAVFDNILEIYDITLYPKYYRDEPEYWGLWFSLRKLQEDHTLPDEFHLNIFFRNEMGEIEYQTSCEIKGNTVDNAHAHSATMYGSSVDFANICSIEISADLSGAAPTLSPTPTATAQPAPTHSTENTSVPQPTQDAPATAQPFSTPGSPGGTESSQTPGILPTEEPAETQMPGKTASPIPSPTLSVTAKPSDTPVSTVQPQVPTLSPTRLPEITALPTVSPAVKPTQVPAVSKPGRTKLVRPVIRIKIRKIYNNMWMAQIRIIKYHGTDIQIYYRRGKGKYKRIKLKRTNIKKNKKIFKVGYKKGKKSIYLRVRTYQKKGGKKWYSPYSKIRRLS